MERRDKHIFGHPQNTNTSMVLGSGFWVLGGGPERPRVQIWRRALSNKHFYKAKEKMEASKF